MLIGQSRDKISGELKRRDFGGRGGKRLIFYEQIHKHVELVYQKINAGQCKHLNTLHIATN